MHFALIVMTFVASFRPITQRTLACLAPRFTAKTTTKAISTFSWTPFPARLCSIWARFRWNWMEELLGVSVDMVTPRDLPVKFRQEVLREARAV